MITARRTRKYDLGGEVNYPWEHFYPVRLSSNATGLVNRHLHVGPDILLSLYCADLIEFYKLKAPRPEIPQLPRGSIDKWSTIIINGKPDRGGVWSYNCGTCGIVGRISFLFHSTGPNAGSRMDKYYCSWCRIRKPLVCLEAVGCVQGFLIKRDDMLRLHEVATNKLKVKEQLRFNL